MPLVELRCSLREEELSRSLVSTVKSSNCSQCLVAHSTPESGPRDLTDDVLRIPLVFQYFITDLH